MNQNIVSAIFDSRDEAERAVSELRSCGVGDDAISIVAQREGKTTTSDGDGVDTDDDTGGFMKGVAGGAAIGTLLGIAALAIPGVGPLVAAGAIATSAIPGAAATGALLGAATGGLGKILTDHGVDDEDATYYEERITTGGTFVSVDSTRAGLNPDDAREILYRAGGHSASRAKAATTI